MKDAKLNKLTNKTDFLNLQDKVAIITGASSGLGMATAQILSDAGTRVVINHLPGQEAEAQSVARQCGGTDQTLCCAGDIVKDDDCKSIVQAAVEQWGQVDILINNAGFNKPVEHNDLEGLSANDFIDLYQVHVIGSYQMIRAVSPIMKAQGKGVVVNVSSGSGKSGYGSSVAYAASKGALNTMTKSLARALAPKIRMNAICPGMVITPIWDKLQHSEKQRKAWLDGVLSAIPLQTEPTAEIIARNILYLASDLSAHITGQLLTVDGGSSLGVYEAMYDKN